jgi:hypothetical protein
MASRTLQEVTLDTELWHWGTARPTRVEYLGRSCVRLESSLATVAGVELEDGELELDLAVGPERGFHGVVWRLRDEESYESFFVRPHQSGNDDAVQYTPVFNDIPSWQLYHGPGFWAPVVFPLDGWFRIRVVFAGERAEVFVGDMETPALAAPLKRPVEPGQVGVQVSGPPIHVSRFAYGPAGTRPFRGDAPAAATALDGAISGWWVSDPFPEQSLAGAAELDRGLLEARSWSHLASEPSGLADLSRVSGIRDGRNTVFARTTLHATHAHVTPLALGFSDRAVVYLNGRALYRGDDTYRSRDYRFLGSIGYWATLFLPLVEGDNNLVVAVSEDFGGWGVQARLIDPAG